MYPFEHFPPQGYKLLIEYLINKVPFSQQGSAQSDNAGEEEQATQKTDHEEEKREEEARLKLS